MRTGTKSVLFGAHAFWLHPFFVAKAYKKLYPTERLRWEHWLAFFVHDIGYIGMQKMDDAFGETHPVVGAKIMEWAVQRWGEENEWFDDVFQEAEHWSNFVLGHSRFLCKRLNILPSKLCYADKLSIILTPSWLYIPMATLSGEIDEYMKLADDRTAAGEPHFQGKYSGMNVFSTSKRQWYANVQEYLKRWLAEHKDGNYDTWTPG